MTTPEHAHCIICGAADAQNPVHHPLVLRADTFACDACFADISTRRPGMPLRQPCAICGEQLHLHSMGTTRTSTQQPVHRSCLSGRAARPLHTVSASIDAWHDQWNDDYARLEES